MPMKRKYGASSKGPSKKAKRSYNKKFTKKASRVYRSVSRKSNTVNSLVGKKHVKTGRKYIKPNPKLDRRIRYVSQKEALKDLPVYDCKEVLLGSLTNAQDNQQFCNQIYTGGIVSASGVAVGALSMLTKSELESLVLKGFGVTNSTAAPTKFNLMYAKKGYTVTNNTFAYLQFSVIEYVFSTDGDLLPKDEWTGSISTLPTVTGAPAQAETQIGQKPYDVDTWKTKFKYKETKFELAPGASYTHTIYCANIDIDMEEWLAAKPYKKGITRGVIFIHNNKQVGCGAAGTDAACTGVAATTAQITIRIDAHFKLTCPANADESQTFDKWYRGVNAPAFVAPAISVFDRTALGLNANV